MDFNLINSVLFYSTPVPRQRACMVKVVEKYYLIIICHGHQHQILCDTSSLMLPHLIKNKAGKGAPCELLYLRMVMTSEVTSPIK